MAKEHTSSMSRLFRRLFAKVAETRTHDFTAFRDRISTLPCYPHDLKRGFWDIDNKRYVRFSAPSHIERFQRIGLDSFVERHGVAEFRDRTCDLVWVETEGRSAKVETVHCLKSYVQRAGGRQDDTMIMKSADGTFWYCVERR